MEFSASNLGVEARFEKASYSLQDLLRYFHVARATSSLAHHRHVGIRKKAPRKIRVEQARATEVETFYMNASESQALKNMYVY